MIVEALAHTKFPPTGKFVQPGTQTHVTPDLARGLESTGEWRIIRGREIRADVEYKRFHRQDREPDEQE